MKLPKLYDLIDVESIIDRCGRSMRELKKTIDGVFDLDGVILENIKLAECASFDEEDPTLIDARMFEGVTPELVGKALDSFIEEKEANVSLWENQRREEFDKVIQAKQELQGKLALITICESSIKWWKLRAKEQGEAIHNELRKEAGNAFDYYRGDWTLKEYHNHIVSTGYMMSPTDNCKETRHLKKIIDQLRHDAFVVREFSNKASKLMELVDRLHKDWQEIIVAIETLSVS